jgi:amino acid transporter
VVLVCNPVLSILSLSILPIPTIQENSSTVLSILADVSGGNWLRIWITLDAVIVLCGGVLTAFVGVAGLLEHMALENLVPGILLSQCFTTPRSKNINNTSSQDNPHTIPPLIPITFLILCSLLYIALKGDVTALSLVFAMSFLTVLGMFVVCNIVLRVRMETESGGFSSTNDGTSFILIHAALLQTLKINFSLATVPTTSTNGGGWTVLFGGALVLVGITGNALYNPSMMVYFTLFYTVLLAVMMLVLNRVRIARLFFFIVGVSEKSVGALEASRRRLVNYFIIRLIRFLC